MHLSSSRPGPGPLHKCSSVQIFSHVFSKNNHCASLPKGLLCAPLSSPACPEKVCCSRSDTRALYQQTGIQMRKTALEANRRGRSGGKTWNRVKSSQKSLKGRKSGSLENSGGEAADSLVCNKVQLKKGAFDPISEADLSCSLWRV